MQYSALARAQHLNLEHSGYIIGFEKRTKRGGSKNKDSYQRLIGLPKELENTGYASFYKKRMVGDFKALYSTHIVSFSKNRANYIQNAYQKQPRSEGFGISESNTMQALELFRNRLKKRLASNNYSHVVVMCMGWNNDQHDAIYRYNKIIQHLKNKNSDGSFKPLVIGITWPSVWGGRQNNLVTKSIAHIASIFNKRNDADELGISYLNWLIHRAIPDSQPQKRKPVVLIGHSFGSVALSRALHSRDYLLAAHKEKNPVDMFIGLQPAYSINRYLLRHTFPRNLVFGGYSYADSPVKKTKIILTTSKHDNANASIMLNFTPNIGGPYGLKKAKKERYSNSIDYVDLGSSNELKAKARNGVPLIVNGSNFIQKREARKEQDEPKLSAHNDILDLDMATFINSCLKQLK